ncbi:Putative GTP-binding protein 6 [Frankliniella fusca]|uniref:GTP-binding protein 6 n=1 Tax=Frankliniella fusca TaxID=407009 RepID=A0AAE1HQQ1_9NEOP|nr:Putative GTP-binding protein 6 [Frankliniella fusca]
MIKTFQHLLRLSSTGPSCGKVLSSCGGWVPPKNTRYALQGTSTNFEAVRAYSDKWDLDVESLLKDEEYEEFSERIFRLPQHGHNVLVIQPFIDYQTNWKDPNLKNTTPELQLEEAEALIKTLSRWKVSGSLLLGVPSYNRSNFFSYGQIERMKDILNKTKNISAVFVSVNILKARQIINLELELDVPVYDRYTIVIQIFKQHAKTKESKLQVAMAELPYLRQCVKGFPLGLSDRLALGSVVGGLGRVSPEKRKDLLQERELKLKKAIISLRKHRERLRSTQKISSYPIVAVMGYTNAGKTSLIKALTSKDSLQPKNQLFATLDVTKHEGLLPCKLKVLYIDTVGFITNIPTKLIESFTATLEDAMCSDVIIHVWDVSNPDFVLQQEHVMNTLKKLQFGENLEQKIFTVANKIDRIAEDKLLELKRSIPQNNTFFVSTKNGQGMEEMLDNLQKKIIAATGRICMKIKVKTGGNEELWIRKNFPVVSIELGNDSEHTTFTVIVTKAQIDTFKYNFLK